MYVTITHATTLQIYLQIHLFLCDSGLISFHLSQRNSLVYLFSTWMYTYFITLVLGLPMHNNEN